VQLSLAAEHVQHVEKLIIFIHIYKYILIRHLYSHTHVEKITKHMYLDKNVYFLNTEILLVAQEFRSDSNLTLFQK